MATCSGNKLLVNSLDSKLAQVLGEMMCPLTRCRITGLAGLSGALSCRSCVNRSVFFVDALPVPDLGSFIPVPGRALPDSLGLYCDFSGALG